MNYWKINNAILAWKDIDESVVKDKAFYNYLLNNRVAYYYCSQLSNKTNKVETKILEAWAERNEIFYKTMETLELICDKYDIEYLLYKTYKYYNEIIWGDIDIIVHENDFHEFLSVFSREWRKCEEDEVGKWKCEKEWYITIEPHVNISWNNIVIPSNNLRVDTTSITIWTSSFNTLNNSFELLSICLKVVVSPEYVDLYDLLIVDMIYNRYDQKIDFNHLENKKINEMVKHIFYYRIHPLTINSPHFFSKFPYFLSTFDILKFNFKIYLELWVINKYMFIHNFYRKRRYAFFNKLPYLTKYIYF
jgi:hypothetical protein